MLAKTKSVKTCKGGSTNEKYWCCGCCKWIAGIKTNVTKHLQKIHEDDDCQIVLVKSTGMLKVDKDDFLPKKKNERMVFLVNDMKLVKQDDDLQRKCLTPKVTHKSDNSSSSKFFEDCTTLSENI